MKKPAIGTTGHLLYSPLDGGYYFFRVYSEDKKSFVDYDLSAEDIEVQIVDRWVAFEETEKGNKLTWTDRALGRK